MSELRRMSSGFQAEIRDAMQTPVAGPPVPPHAVAPSRPSRSREFLSVGPDPPVG